MESSTLVRQHIYIESASCYHTVELCIVMLNTVECHYNVIQYNMIMHTSLLWLSQNINESLNPQKTPHISPYRANYGVSFVMILVKIDHVITTPHYSFFVIHAIDILP